MENIQDFEKLYEEMENIFSSFRQEHAAFVENGNKAAGGRARKDINALKKTITTYRKMSTEISKSISKKK